MTANHTSNDSVDSVEGIGRAYSRRLENAGYASLNDVADETMDTLREKTNIPDDRLSALKEAADEAAQEAMSSLAQARKEAASKPGAKVETVKIDGEQRCKVLEKEREIRKPGATVTVRKG